MANILDVILLETDEGRVYRKTEAIYQCVLSILTHYSITVQQFYDQAVKKDGWTSPETHNTFFAYLPAHLADIDENSESDFVESK